MHDATAVARPVMQPRNVRWALLGVMFGMLLAMLDNFIVGTAMPTIVSDIGGAPLLSWVVTAYALTTAVSTPIWGKLGDLFGRKDTFLASVTIFILGSVLAGLAPSMELLIASRALQGIGTGGLAVGAFAVIGDLVPPRERGRYQGMVAIVVSAGTIGGPLVGGFITDTFGWRWAFIINLPLGLITLIWTWLLLDIPTIRRHARIDWAGALLLGGAISAIVLLTTWGGSARPWLSAPIITLMVAAAVALSGFLWHERRTVEPLLPLRIFANRSFTMSALIALTMGAAAFACILYLPLFQQTVQGASAARSGLLLLPMAIPVVIVSLLAGRLMTQTGRYKIFPIIGTVSFTIGAVLLSTMTTQTHPFTTGGYLVFIGIGLGLTQQMTTTIAQNAVDQEHLGASSGVITLLRTLGGAVGVAIFGTIFTKNTTGTTGEEYLNGIADSTHTMFLYVAITSAIAIAASMAIHETPLRGSANTHMPPEVDLDGTE